MPSLSWIFCLTLSIESAGLHLQSDGLARQRLHEDLHAAAKTEHQMQSRLLLDVVVRQRAPVLELLAREDQALLVWRDALLVLDLLLDVVDRVSWPPPPE
jgi:hypothetical protein